MVGTFLEPSCGRRHTPIHSIPYSVAQPLERGSNNYYSIIQGGIHHVSESIAASAHRGTAAERLSQKPIEEPAVVELEDLSHGMRRTEVRSRAGDSHLGHVFTGDPESPNGVRYCINSAALRFVPYEKMEAEGYGYLLYLFEK